MTILERTLYCDSYDEVEESRMEQELREEDRAYFPIDESNPPHY